MFRVKLRGAKDDGMRGQVTQDASCRVQVNAVEGDDHDPGDGRDGQREPGLSTGH
jgi:hypothetical protein